MLAGLAAAVAAPAVPSGLQISMLFLFQIIAGLMLADLFKQSVEVLNRSAAIRNLLLILAAAAFLIRLLVDNFIFYAGADEVPRNTVDYVTRITLLLIDLAAFAVAYDLVHQISAAGLRQPDLVISFRRARRVLCGMATIEVLHTGWGLLDTWLTVRNGATLRSAVIGTTHGTVAGRWLLLSAVFAVLPLPLIKTLRHSEEAADTKSMVAILAFSLLSAVTYAVVMKDYYIGQLQP